MRAAEYTVGDLFLGGKWRLMGVDNESKLGQGAGRASDQSAGQGAGRVPGRASESKPAFENLGFEDLGFAKVDFDRKRRQGVGEVIYGAGKTPAQIAAIAGSLYGAGQDPVLVTRLDKAAAEEVRALLPDELAGAWAYYETPRIGMVGAIPEPDGKGIIAVAAAGTSDLPVAEEAALVAEALGNRVDRLYDVGVAGIHRLLANEERIAAARVVIAVAGMEGALASVVGGLARCPVIAVPTSIGYGASFGGLSALLAMLNSCASNVSVVNIDNGFGAGFQASLINHLE